MAGCFFSLPSRIKCGSITLPKDFDIFRPSRSKTNPCTNIFLKSKNPKIYLKKFEKKNNNNNNNFFSEECLCKEIN
jgi:hypothetical protein